MNLFEKILRPIYLALSSMTLAIVLLMVLAIASVIGTVLLQNQEQTDYLTQFGPIWYWTFRSLGLFDMYHTWWFITLLGFLLLSLVLCLWRHTPRMLKEMRSRKVIIADKSLLRFHHLHHWTIKGSGQNELIESVESGLGRWETRRETSEGRDYIRADRGRHHKWGYILAHSGILIILIGGWMSVEFGFRGNMGVAEGSKAHEISYLKGTGVETKEMPFEVRCNDFSIDFFPTGQPKEFRSNLTIIDEGKEVLTSDIIVNEPLYYKGVRIYQASFGDGGSHLKFKLFRLDGSRTIDMAEADVYGTYRDEKTGVTLEIQDFKPFNVQNMAAPGEPKDFKDLGPSVEYVIRGPGLTPVKVKSFMNPLVVQGQNQGMVLMISLTGDARDYEYYYLGLDFTNPDEWALFHSFIERMQGSNPADERANLKAFKAALTDVFGDKQPEDLQLLGLRAIQGATALSSLPWPFVPMLDDFDLIYYTGLQLAQDPGMNVVWGGSLLLVIGLCIMFYMPHRRIWIVIAPEGKGTKVTIGGTTNRNQLGFENEFNDLLTRIGERLQPKSS